MKWEDLFLFTIHLEAFGKLFSTVFTIHLDALEYKFTIHLDPLNTQYTIHLDTL